MEVSSAYLGPALTPFSRIRQILPQDLGEGVSDSGEFVCASLTKSPKPGLPDSLKSGRRQSFTFETEFWLTRSIGCWRGGPKHLPVRAQVMYHWQPWQHKKLQHTLTRTEVDRLDVQTALHNEADTRIVRFRAEVHTMVAQGVPDIETLIHTLP